MFRIRRNVRKKRRVSKPTSIRKAIWYTITFNKNGGSRITEQTAVTGNITVYAHWKKTAVPKTVNKPVLKNRKKGQVAVSFKAVKGGADGYEIQYATNSKFKKASAVTTTGKKAVLKKMKKGKTCYVRIRACNLDSAGGRIYGKYSGTVKIRIKK